jgi:hypothetical protein
MQDKFAQRLAQIQQDKHSDVGLLLAPRLAMLPYPMARFDDPFLPFGKAIIEATQQGVCAYVFDLAAYLALGAAGAVALERTLAYVPDDALKILHAPFASIHYVQAVGDNAFNVDAVTVTDLQFMQAYLQLPHTGAFVVIGGQSKDYGIAGNVYWIDEGLFTLVVGSKEVLKIQLAGEHILYASRGEDFAQQTRDALEKLRDAR